VHGSTVDTGLPARIDSIRAVRVNVYASNGRTGSSQVTRALATTIRIPNAGLTKQRSCGDTPIFGKPLTAVFSGTAAAPKVTLTWLPATDETAGEKDVERYLIYRRTTAGFFDAAQQTMPAGQAAYTYTDATVLNDSTYYFEVTALDCTPLESSPSVSGSVTIPPAP
jgi:hypothetical protein